MKRLLNAVLAALLLAAPSPTFAQSVDPGIRAAAQGGYLPAGANFCSPDAGATWAPCTATSRGGSNIVTGQVTIGTTATPVAVARAGRQRIDVTVVPAVQCAFGGPGVTLATGWPLAAIAYASDSWPTSAALYGVCASAATTVAYRELF